MDYFNYIEHKLLNHLLTDPEDPCPEGMEKFEVNAILEKFEKKGYVHVSWASGHDAEAVKVNDSGRIYLKSLNFEKNKASYKTRQQRRREYLDRCSQISLQRQIARESNSEIFRLQSEIKRLEHENSELKARVAELETKSLRKYDREVVISELNFIFNGRLEYIEQFLDQIEGLKSKQITSVVNSYVKSELINNKDASSKSLYDILYKHQIYTKLYATWHSQVVWKNEKIIK